MHFEAANRYLLIIYISMTLLIFKITIISLSVTQILREINFGGLKDVVFVILGDLNLVFLVIFSFQKVQ